MFLFIKVKFNLRLYTPLKSDNKNNNIFLFKQP